MSVFDFFKPSSLKQFEPETWYRNQKQAGKFCLPPPQLSAIIDILKRDKKDVGLLTLLTNLNMEIDRDRVTLYRQQHGTLNEVLEGVMQSVGRNEGQIGPIEIVEEGYGAMIRSRFSVIRTKFCFLIIRLPKDRFARFGIVPAEIPQSLDT
jgi:hypothetical protein